MTNIDEVFHPEESKEPATSFFGAIAWGVGAGVALVDLAIWTGLLDWTKF